MRYSKRQQLKAIEERVEYLRSVTRGFSLRKLRSMAKQYVTAKTARKA
jgi:hypothetical protein